MSASLKTMRNLRIVTFMIPRLDFAYNVSPTIFWSITSANSAPPIQCKLEVNALTKYRTAYSIRAIIETAKDARKIMYLLMVDALLSRFLKTVLSMIRITENAFAVFLGTI